MDDLPDQKTEEATGKHAGAVKTRRGLAAEAIDIAKTLGIALAIAVSVRSFAFEPFHIPSGSMYPTLEVGDYIFVSKFSYGYSRYSFPFDFPPFSGRVFGSGPERGDVVVFALPTDPQIDYVKRVIGLPGDTVETRGGRLYINDQLIERARLADYPYPEMPGVVRLVPHYEETLPEGRKHTILEMRGDTYPADNAGPFKVPAGHVFMMGDNRDNSQDSRFLSAVGPVPIENLIGKASFIFFSWNGFSSNPLEWLRFGRLFHAVD